MGGNNLLNSLSSFLVVFHRTQQRIEITTHPKVPITPKTSPTAAIASPILGSHLQAYTQIDIPDRQGFLIS